ncbi:DUF3891 family protein [Bacillus sp. SCS-153A]|uniref:DUF3891 family protein n=1 Tax=Rossellomorea sedimentorum TaxID=3115294 RepID=UPI0039060640
MIIRENNDSFIMIRQHDHANLSGEITRHFNPSIFKSNQFFEDVVHAAREHDRGWIDLDETPIWNDTAEAPYSFADYPLLPKLAFYTIGLDEIETINVYAALLCSMHFCSFFSQTKNPDGLHFLHAESKRQKNIKKNLPVLDEDLLHQHFRLLQFSDDLSLYLCLNEPGVEKDHEHPWFKKGFRNTELFNPRRDPLTAHWQDSHKVTVDPFPFLEEFQLTLIFKKVSKQAMRELGIAQAYRMAEVDQQRIYIMRS